MQNTALLAQMGRCPPGNARELTSDVPAGQMTRHGSCGQSDCVLLDQIFI